MSRHTWHPIVEFGAYLRTTPKVFVALTTGLILASCRAPAAPASKPVTGQSERRPDELNIRVSPGRPVRGLTYPSSVHIQRLPVRPEGSSERKRRIPPNRPAGADAPNWACDFDTPAPCFHGGKTLQQVHVVPILYGQVDPDVATAIPGFYDAFLQSSYMAWLSEYDTTTNSADSHHFCNGVPAGGQTIGPGSVAATVTMAPPSAWGTTLKDTDLVNELACMVGGACAGEPSLPSQDQDPLFVVYVPPSVTGTVTDTSNYTRVSCKDMLGYHSTFQVNDKLFAYAVIFFCPSFDPTTPVDEATAISSHELVEAITDPDISAPAWSWPDSGQCDELSDICAGEYVDFKGYRIQRSWSIERNECYVPCGVVGLPCCDQGASCEAGAVCNAKKQCSCGERGEICCPNSSCSGLTKCVNGTCECGRLGDPCCVPGGTCDLSLTCANGYCVTQANPCASCKSNQTACKAKCGSDTTCQCLCENSYCGCIQGGQCGLPHCIFQTCK